MKKFILLVVNLLILTTLVAQKPSLTKAYNCFYDKDYDKAKEQIDLCAADEKLSAKAQTWLYKGNIEFLLANREYSEKQKNESYQIRYPNAPEEAFDAFEKAIAINPKVEASPFTIHFKWSNAVISKVINAFKLWGNYDVTFLVDESIFIT